MKLLAAFIGLVAVASAVESRITYNGFRAVRIPTENNPAAVKEKLGSLPVTHLNVDTSEYMDIAVGPEEQEAFDKLGLYSDVLIEDLAAAFEAEGDLVPYECMLFCLLFLLFFPLYLKTVQNPSRTNSCIQPRLLAASPI